MSAHDLNTALQISCIALLGLVTILLLKYAKTGTHTWTGISLALCVICYLMLEIPFIKASTPLFLIAVTGSISIPVVFFLLTKAIFDDHFRPSYLILAWLALEIIPHYWIYLQEFVSVSDSTRQVSTVVAEIVSIGFVLAGLYTAIKTKKADL